MDEAFFQAQYAADAQNRSRQTWDEYAKWVRTFYEGKRFPPVPGWVAREREILDKLPAEAKESARGSVAAIGRLLAAEWAKDNDVRRVATGDLQSWGKRFAEAAKDAATLRLALEEVEAEVGRRIAAKA